MELKYLFMFCSECTAVLCFQLDLSTTLHWGQLIQHVDTDGQKQKVGIYFHIEFVLQVELCPQLL